MRRRCRATDRVDQPDVTTDLAAREQPRGATRLLASDPAEAEARSDLEQARPFEEKGSGDRARRLPSLRVRAPSSLMLWTKTQKSRTLRRRDDRCATRSDSRRRRASLVRCP